MSLYLNKAIIKNKHFIFQDKAQGRGIIVGSGASGKGLGALTPPA